MRTHVVALAFDGEEVWLNSTSFESFNTMVLYPNQVSMILFLVKIRFVFLAMYLYIIWFIGLFLGVQTELISDDQNGNILVWDLIANSHFKMEDGVIHVYASEKGKSVN